MCFKAPKMPDPPKPIPPADMLQQKINERRTRAGSKGFASNISEGTLLGGGSGGGSSAGAKTLLGA